MSALPAAPALPELLAPAGGMEQLAAALRFGADAVYGGMTRYGLRAGAAGFDAQALPRAVGRAHAQSKPFYVTLNLLPFDRDMDGLLAAAREASAAGADAAIVSDIGAALLLRAQLPKPAVLRAGSALWLASLLAACWPPCSWAAASRACNSSTF